MKRGFLFSLSRTLCGIALCGILTIQYNVSTAEVEADSMSYLTDESKIIASGNVELTQQGRKLFADEVTYNQKTRLVTAIGNLKFTGPEGHVLHADKAEMHDSLERGHIENLHGTLSGDSTIAAARGDRLDKDTFSLENAFFTPCHCAKDAEALWSIRADKVTLDDAEEEVHYDDAMFQIMGQPVLYTPRFMHPMPGAKRRSGLLVPTYMGSNVLGASVKIPYYFNIAPEADATVAPIFTSREGPVFSGEFRHLTAYGPYEFGGSLTNPKERDVLGNQTTGRDVRGHIEGKGRFQFDDYWQGGFDAKRSTDDTYLRRYGFSHEDLLTSHGYAERIEQRNYGGIKAVSFQGLNAEDDPDNSPVALPLVNTHHERKTSFHNSTLSLDTNGLFLTRGEGIQSRRLATTGGWKLPLITPQGHKFELSASLRGDAYQVQDVDDPIDPINDQDGFTGRFIPEGKLSWAFPVVQENVHTRILLEPLADFILSPQGGNPSKIPNEDSQELEISDFNLFSSHRYTGLDRVEGGPRTNYGLRGGIYKQGSAANVTFLAGQNYRTKKDENFTRGSGLDDNFSDYVGRIAATDGNLLNAVYRVRVDKDDGAFRRNEVATWLNFGRLNIQGGYVRLDDETGVEPREELVSGGSLLLTEHWSFHANGRRDLGNSGGWVSNGASLVFENECLIIATALNREYTRDRDIEPATSISLQVSFKNLGI